MVLFAKLRGRFRSEGDKKMRDVDDQTTPHHPPPQSLHHPSPPSHPTLAPIATAPSTSTSASISTSMSASTATTTSTSMLPSSPAPPPRKPPLQRIPTEIITATEQGMISACLCSTGISAQSVSSSSRAGGEVLTRGEEACCTDDGELRKASLEGRSVLFKGVDV